jgi:hypothetical protein
VINGSKVSEIIGLDKMVQIGSFFTLAMPIALPPFPPLR